MNDKTVLEVRRPAPSIPESQPALPSFAEAVRVWMKIGLLSFGGPAGQIALLHREVVDAVIGHRGEDAEEAMRQIVAEAQEAMGA